MKACASFASPSPAVASMAAAPTASPPPSKTEGKIPKKEQIVIDASLSPSSVAGAEPVASSMNSSRRAEFPSSSMASRE